MALSSKNTIESKQNKELEDEYSKETQKSLEKTFELINTELSPEVEQKLNALESILQAKDKKQRAEAIEEAAKILGKSTRTIRRMLTKIANFGH